MRPPNEEAPAGAAAGASREQDHAPGGAASFCSNAAVGGENYGAAAYGKMCRAIKECHEELVLGGGLANLDQLPLQEQLRISLHIAMGAARLARMACEIRMRAERNFNVLLRDAVGLPAKNKRDVNWLTRFCP